MIRCERHNKEFKSSPLNKTECRSKECNCIVVSGELFPTIENFNAWQQFGICMNCQEEIIEMQKGSSNPSKLTDPAVLLMLDDHKTTPNESIYRADCYICNDPEYAAMGLPLCSECVAPGCEGGHVAADDDICDKCGANQMEFYV